MAKKPPKRTRIEGDVNITDGDFVAGDKTTIHGEEPAKSRDLDGSIDVTGGDVVFGDKIIKFIQESLNIYLFKDIFQLAMFLSFVVLVFGGVGGAYWYTQQPQKMTGDFNIAVADFTAAGGADQDVADALSQHIFRFLDDEAQLITAQDIQVAHRNIRAISSAQ